MSDRLVSIIMPVYNSEKYLSKAIESVLSQTYKNFELIAVDDGSTDESFRILESFREKDKRIKVFSKQNGGISSARNYGLKKSLGEYIAFLDNDDEYDKKLLEDNLELIEKNNAEIVKFNKVKKIIGKTIECKSVKFNFEENIFLESEDIFKNFDIVYKYGGTIWNAMYSKQFLTKYNIEFDESDKDIIEDHRFNLECYKHVKKMVLNPKAYYYWNMRVEHSTTGKFIYNRFDQMKIEANNLYNLLIKKDIQKLNQNFWIMIKDGYLFNILLVMNYQNSGFNMKKQKEYLIGLKKYEVFKRKITTQDYNFLKKQKNRINYYVNKLGLELFDKEQYFLLILICNIKFKYDIKFKNKRF